MLGRNYEWGFVDSLDPKNSDFNRLHKLVLKYIREELVSTMKLKYGKFEGKLSEMKDLDSQKQENYFSNLRILQFGFGMTCVMGAAITYVTKIKH